MSRIERFEELRPLLFSIASGMMHEAPEAHQTRDGGGEASPWPTCVAGAEQVARVLAAIVPALARRGVTMQPHRVDEGPGVVFRDRNGDVLGALVLDILEERIRTIRWVTDPDGRAP
ncbi:hypothetical protein [Streptomyces sp. NPDC096012]|uniref:hypothetical protein n=1 Tax=Streptomyces sp. NPDC096012 TaxID=3155684 RepID=UPI00336A63A0